MKKTINSKSQASFDFSVINQEPPSLNLKEQFEFIDDGYELSWKKYLSLVHSGKHSHDILLILRHTYDQRHLTPKDLNRLSKVFIDKKVTHPAAVEQILICYLALPAHPYSGRPYAFQLMKYELARKLFKRTNNYHYLEIAKCLLNTFLGNGDLGNQGSVMEELRYEMELERLLNGDRDSLGSCFF